MNTKYILLLIIIVLLFSCIGKNSKNADKVSTDTTFVEMAAKIDEFDEDKLIAKTVYDFVPPNYEVLQILEEDGIDFCFLLIRVINPDAIMQHEYRGELNFNRRGIILAFYDDKNYQLVVRNKDFFESDSEGGDGYSAPELSVEISNGNLIFAYLHEIEGSWRYTFRYQDNAFELIGYDSSVGSLEYANTEYSINFLTKRMKITTYKEKDSQSEDEEPQYDPEIQWKNIEIQDSYQLSADERGIDGLSEYVQNFIGAENIE